MGSNCITLLDHDTYCQAEICPFSAANCTCKSVIFPRWQVEREGVGVNAIKECCFNEVGFTAGLAAVQWRWRFSAFARLHQSEKKKKKRGCETMRMCGSSGWLQQFSAPRVALNSRLWKFNSELLIETRVPLTFLQTPTGEVTSCLLDFDSRMSSVGDFHSSG